MVHHQQGLGSMGRHRRWRAIRIARVPRRSEPGSFEGNTVLSRMPPIGIVLVSSLLIVGLSGCSALSSWMSGGTEEEAVGTLSPEEAAQQPTTLEKIVDGARVEMPGSGFAMTFPGDWTVERVDPDPDVFAAAPGDAWEALRAYGPERREACSLSVAVAPEGQESSGVAASGDAAAPYWSIDDSQPILVVAPPRLEIESGGGMETIAPHERPRTSDPRLEHDAQYVVACVTDPPRFLDAIIQSVEFLPSDG